MKIKYRFHNPELLKQALTHPSCTQHRYCNDSLENYERLEFLGDGILSMVIKELLYHRYKDASDGHLSVMHANLVNSVTLVKIATRINIGAALLMDDGEDQSGGRTKPKNLENSVEALIAAIYLDSDYATIVDFIKELWGDFLSNHTLLMQKDNKSTLQEWAQSKDYDLPKYFTQQVDGVSHMPIFTIKVVVGNFSGIGTGKTKKEAEQNAAADLLQQIY